MLGLRHGHPYMRLFGRSNQIFYFFRNNKVSDKTERSLTLQEDSRFPDALDLRLFMYIIY